MAVTGQEILNMALALLGERADSLDIDDYRERAVPLLNIMFIETASFNRLANNDNTIQEVVNIDLLNDEVDLDERLTKNVLPYALAARLILEEDPERGAFFNTLYEKKFKALRCGKIKPIKRVCF